MFQTLSDRLSQTLKKIRGQGRLPEDNVKESLREVRISLLEADVALPVVKAFLDQVKQRAMGQEVLKSLDPGQVFVKIVNDELIDIMGAEAVPLNLQAQPPAVVLMAGLQGSGKTTSTAKLARYLIERENKKVMVCSADVYRPAAIDQLETLAKEVGAEFFPSQVNENPVDIAKNAVQAAKTQYCDVLLLDTAGRLHIDEAMMSEIKAVHKAISPVETLFVVDSMTGQDAANTAKAFHEALPLSGIILTKTDGDARGGAALSIRHITGKPIKFIGSGEKSDALVVFHPERIASRILGMGDILSLVEEAERKVDKEKTEKLAKKLKKGKGFDLEDFRDQILQMNQMGGITGMMSKMPGMGNLPTGAMDSQAGEKSLKQIVAIINSMILKERRFPKLINGSRKKRIAKGSGTQIQDINRLLKQFTQMQKMMKKFAKPGAMKKMLRGMQGMIPPGGGQF